MLTAASTVDIFSASSLGMSKPKYSSIATTNSTESRESKPSSSKVADLFNLDWSHLAADFNTWYTLASTSYRIAVWVGSEDEVKKYLGVGWVRVRAGKGVILFTGRITFRNDRDILDSIFLGNCYFDY